MRRSAASVAPHSSDTADLSSCRGVSPVPPIAGDVPLACHRTSH